MIRGLLIAIFLLPIGSITFSSRGEDWSQWRGPNRNGITSEKGWSTTWPKEGPRVVWKANVGLGFSSFVTGGGKVFTIGHRDDLDSIYCFDAGSGKEIWKHSYPSELGDKYFEGGTTGSPTFSNGRVYTLSRWGDLFCLNAENGKIVWSRNLQKDSNARIPGWGFGGSPTVYGNLLVLNVGDAGMAVDKETGKKVWESPRKDAGYSTPLLFDHHGKMAVTFGSAQSFLAVEPMTGKEIWRIRWVTQYGVNAADPVVAGDKIFISSGYGKGAALLKLTDASEPETVWKSKVLRSQLNASVLLDDFLYGFDGDTTDKAALKCVEFNTGAEKWADTELGLGSLIAGDGKLIILSERGELIVALASPETFKPIARAQILGGKSWTAPVLANGFLYCRNSRGDLACVDLRSRR
jgi:outer membrane protein assembly factor BamB